MSLQTNMQQNNEEKNPWKKGDLLSREVLWEFINNSANPEKIIKESALYRAIRQFTWFHTSEQKVLYDKFNLNELRGLSKYLKE